jgi:hypothetical protein
MVWMYLSNMLVLRVCEPLINSILVVGKTSLFVANIALLHQLMRLMMLCGCGKLLCLCLLHEIILSKEISLA